MLYTDALRTGIVRGCPSSRYRPNGSLWSVDHTTDDCINFVLIINGQTTCDKRYLGRYWTNAASVQWWRIDGSRVQAAGADHGFTCSCCNSPPVIDKWTPDVDDDSDKVQSSESVDSTADWYQQQIVHIQNDTALRDIRHQRSTPNDHDAQSANVGSSVLAFVNGILSDSFSSHVELLDCSVI